MDAGVISIVDGALRGAVGAIVVLTIVVLLREGAQSRTARMGALFGVGVIAYLNCSAPWSDVLPMPLFYLTLSLCIANPVLFWLFGRSLFDDNFQPRLFDLLLAVGVVGFGLLQHSIAATWSNLAQNLLLVMLQLVAIALVGHVFVLALAGRRDDLVSARRRFRVPFVVGIGLYVLMLAVAEIGFASRQPPAWLETLNIAGLLLLSLFIAISMVRLRTDDMLGSLAVPRETGDMGTLPLDDSGPAHRLDDFIRRSKAYLKEGLTVSELAAMAAMPEYRLRRVINQSMGFRNFTAFINSYRLSDAKAALADPNRTRTPVLTIALELGYRSIGPFNRAFKADTGMTPTQFRQRALDLSGN